MTNYTHVNLLTHQTSMLFLERKKNTTAERWNPSLPDEGLAIYSHTCWPSQQVENTCMSASYYTCIDEGSLHDWDCWPQYMQRRLCKTTKTFWRVLRMRLHWMQVIYVYMFEYIFTPAENKTHLMLQGRWEKGKEPGIKPRAPGWSVAVRSPGCSAIINSLWTSNSPQVNCTEGCGLVIPPLVGCSVARHLHLVVSLVMIQSSASFLGRFLASAGSVFFSLTLEANIKIRIVTQYIVHQCILIPNISYFNWRVLLSHIPTRNLAVLIWTKYEG